MFDFIAGLWKREFQLAHLSEITGHLEEILQLFSEEYVHDQNARDAAIDALVNLLKSYKSKPE